MRTTSNHTHTLHMTTTLEHKGVVVADATQVRALIRTVASQLTSAPSTSLVVSDATIERLMKRVEGAWKECEAMARPVTAEEMHTAFDVYLSTRQCKGVEGLWMKLKFDAACCTT